MTHMRIELTDKCNLACKHCFQEESVFGDMPLDVLETIIAICELNHEKKVLLSGGEISIYPFLKEALHMLADRNMEVDIYTNAIFAENNSIKQDQIDMPNEELSKLIIDKSTPLLKKD